MISGNSEINGLIKTSKEVLGTYLLIYVALLIAITITVYMFWITYFISPNILLKYTTYFVLVILLYIVLTEMHDLATNLLKIKLFSENFYMSLEYLLIPLSIILSFDLITDLITNFYREYQVLFALIDTALVLGETFLLYLLGRKIIIELNLKEIVNKLYGNIYGLLYSFWEKLKRKELYTSTTYPFFMMFSYLYVTLGLQGIRILSLATGHITINSILNCIIIILIIKQLLYSSTISYMIYTGILPSSEQRMNLRNLVLTLNRRQPMVFAIYFKSVDEVKAYIESVFQNPLNDVVILIPHNINSECTRFIRETGNNNRAVIIYLRDQMIAMQKLPISTDRKIFYIGSPQFMQINYILSETRFTAPTLRLIICLVNDIGFFKKTDITMIYRFIRGIIDYFYRPVFPRVLVEFVVSQDLPERISELITLIVHDKYTLSKK